MQNYPNKIRDAADARRRAEIGLRANLAIRADDVWDVLQVELAQFQPSEMGLVTDYLIERARAYRAQRSMEQLQKETNALVNIDVDGLSNPPVGGSNQYDKKVDPSADGSIPARIEPQRSGLFPVDDNRKTLNIIELAELSGIKTTTLREWVSRKRIPGAFRITKDARWLFRREDLEKWWAELINKEGK
jgi:excisionase family DNA binding protein